MQGEPTMKLSKKQLVDFLGISSEDVLDEMIDKTGTTYFVARIDIDLDFFKNGKVKNADIHMRDWLDECFMRGSHLTEEEMTNATEKQREQAKWYDSTLNDYLEEEPDE